MIDLNDAKKVSALLIALSFLYYLPGVVSPRDFWVEDEARYAEVMREMMQNGRLLVPHLNGHYYPDKPPVYFWLTGIVAAVTGGVTPFAFMVVTWFSTALCVVVAYRFSLEIFNARTAFIGALVFLSNLLVLICAQIVRMDMLMAAFIVLALHAFYRGYTRGAAVWHHGFYLFSALAVLTKGPLGIAFPLLAAIAFLVHKKQYPEMGRLLLHPGWALFFALVGGWLFGAWITGYGDYVHNLFFKQMAGRAVNAFSQKQPFHFYFLLLPALLMPWTGFVPRAAVRAFKSGSDGVLLYLYWFGSGFLLISLISGKLFVYPLPLLIPLFWIIAEAIDASLAAPETEGRYFPLEAGFNILICFGIFGVFPFVAGNFPVVDQLTVWPFAVIFLPLTAIGLWLSLSRHIRAAVGVTVTGVWLFSAFAFLAVLPNADHLLSARAIGYEIAEFKENGWEVAIYRVRRGILNFYADTLLPELDDTAFQTWLETPKRALIMDDDWLERPPLAGNDEITVVALHEIANQKFVIVTAEKPSWRNPS